MGWEEPGLGTARAVGWGRAEQEGDSPAPSAGIGTRP